MSQTQTNTATGKLHEILAVEGDHEGRSKAAISESIATFKNKERLFQAKTRTLTMFQKNETNRVELEAIEAKEKTETPLAATVPENLNYLGVILAEYYDVVFQKEATNQQAKADVIINGETLLTDVPVTFLLSMESRLKEVRNVIVEIPTLEPTIAWVPDTTHAKAHVYKAPVTHDTKTLKETKHNIVVAPTDKHPAQVVAYDAVSNIGQYTDAQWSGKITSATKATLLQNIDSLIQAVKKARQRANATTLVPSNDVGNKLMKFLLGDFFKPENANPTSVI